MTREKVRELLPIIQAFVEGKTIQYRVLPPFSRIDKRDTSYLKEWVDLDEDRCDGFSCDETINYRIKPEPKYRPFKTKEECWNEMLKHQPFGWLINRDAQYINPLSIGDGKNFVDWFKLYTFADSSPFGIKEE